MFESAVLLLEGKYSAKHGIHPCEVIIMKERIEQQPKELSRLAKPALLVIVSIKKATANLTIKLAISMLESQEKPA